MHRNSTRRSASLLGLALVGALIAGCSESPDSGVGPTSSAPTPQSPTPPPATASNRPAPESPAPTATPAPTPVVILVSIDGLNPDAITQLDQQGRVPTLRLLRAEGASTLNARTAYEQTNTLPNHTGILTGRPISGPEGTGVTFNSDRPGTLAQVKGRYLAGVFDPVHDAGLSTAFLAEKSKFEFLIRSWERGARDRTGPDNGTDKVDFAKIDTNPDLLTRDLLTRLRTKPPHLTFLHIAGPDEVGHGDPAGFMGPRYLDAVAAADRQLGRILREVRTNPKLAARTTVIVTADHGGRGANTPPGYGHRVPTVRDNYRIPFIVWGPKVPAGVDLYALNRGDRGDPGRGRPAYTGPQPVRNLDAANLVLQIFGFGPLPGTQPNGLSVLAVR